MWWWRIVLLLGLALADEHWFVFDQNQFPGFDTPLFTLIFNNITGQNDSKIIDLTLSTYDRAIQVELSQGNFTERTIRLNLERADFFPNTFNHLIFLAIRQQNKFETYVNCKLIDSYLLYSTHENNSSTSYELMNFPETIKHFHTVVDDHQYYQEIFEQYGCKQTPISDNQTTSITKPLIRKMQDVIDKVQRRKQRTKRHQTQLSLSDSLTIIYRPNLVQSNDTDFHTIFNLSQLTFSIRYYPNEHLFDVRFRDENRTQFLLYADKSTDLDQSSTTTLFLHITPMMISCYVNCELTDQEYLVDSVYTQNLIRQMMEKERTSMEYDRQSTLILFNSSIEQIARKFFCLKLDGRNEDLLPEKYALRKFINALDILANSLETISNDPVTTTTSTTTLSVSAVNIHTINGFGSLVAPAFQTDPHTISNDILEYDRTCFTDQDCSSNTSLLKCQYSHCICPPRYFWSSHHRRCIVCKDLSIGHRCFRLSNHKSTWYEANDYCQDENSLDEHQEYRMKLTSNINRTDIQLLKQTLLDENNGEQLDYFYWIGATSHFDTRKIHQRTKRRIPSTIFRWYDNGEIVQLDTTDLWCSQREQSSNNNHQLCISLTSCGLYADDCQRNYRFLCEAI